MSYKTKTLTVGQTYDAGAVGKTIKMVQMISDSEWSGTSSDGNSDVSSTVWDHAKIHVGDLDTVSCVSGEIKLHIQ